MRAAPDGTRWHRCLRCDSWLVLPAPEQPTRERPPSREELVLPLRGRALRDKVVLRIIAVDRGLHFIVLGAIAAAILVFAASRASLQGTAYRVLADIQGGLGQSTADSGHGIFHELRRLFAIQQGTLTKVAIAVALYALLEGVEAVGLWWQKRWAEYLTFVATALLLPLEIYELANTLSPLKLITFTINLAVVIYLLLAKRLFGLRGGAEADRRERERDTGWPAVDRATPA